MHIQPLCSSPRLYQIDDFASDEEVAQLLAAAAGRRQTTGAKRDETGFSFELPVAGSAPAESLRARIAEAVGIDNRLGATLRFRHYQRGEQHPRHRDGYVIAGQPLVATALLYLSTPTGGGTSFPGAQPEPVIVQAKKGRLVFWLNYLADGTEDPASEHESLAVTDGDKITLTAFIYAPAAAAAKPTATGEVTLSSATLAKSGAGLRFHCIDEGVTELTTDLLRSACQRRGVEYVSVPVEAFDFRQRQPLGKGDLLYRPATSLAALRVEQLLVSDEVATFYAQPRGGWFDCVTPPLVLERAGVPIPRTVYVPTNDRALLSRYVEWLGGFPLVVKWLGRSHGVGVVRVDSLPALYSLMDHAVAGGANPFLCQYIADAVHYRVVVVGGRAVASYRNAQIADDFRSYGSDDLADYVAPLATQMAAIAERATAALGLEMAGVDVLRAPSGELFVLEANFPCYFGQAQHAVGVDIAGLMLDHLITKSRR